MTEEENSEAAKLKKTLGTKIRGEEATGSATGQSARSRWSDERERERERENNVGMEESASKGQANLPKDGKLVASLRRERDNSGT